MSGRYRSAPMSPEVAWYLSDRGFEVEDWQAPTLRTGEPGPDSGAEFDPERVDRVIEFLSLLRHTQGALAGQPLAPMEWQVAYIIAPLFGWVVENENHEWVRFYRRGFISVARKASKTTLSAGLMTYLTFGEREPGAQGLFAAATKDQARLAFDPVRHVVEQSPAFQKAGIRTTRAMIERLSDGSYLKPVVGDGAALQGLNVHADLVDEIHVHPNLDLLNALEAGSGARKQPMSLIITTADDGRAGTPYDILVKAARHQARSDYADDSRQYATVWTTPKSMRIDDPEAWRRANPGLGQTPTYDYMKQAAAKAKTSPVERAFFQRYHLNQRVTLQGEFLSETKWSAGDTGPIDESTLEGRPCVAGVDLGAVSDLTSVCFLFPDDEGEGATALWRTWLPGDNFDDLNRRTSGLVSQWVEDGYLRLTEGNVLDVEAICSQILDDMDRFEVMSIGYDPYGSTRVVPPLVEEGAPMVKVRQGYLTMSPAMKEIQRLVYKGQKGRPVLRHHDPVADWCVSNLSVATDPAGNVKPDKARSQEKIDCVSAMATAMSEFLAKFGEGDQRGVEFLSIGLL